MNPNESKARLLARCDEYIAANENNYGASTQMTVQLARRVREELEKLTLTQAYMTERAVLAKEVPTRWGDVKVHATDLLQFVPPSVNAKVQIDDLVIPNCD